MFRLSAMECTTQKESGTHGIKGNGGNEVASQTVNKCMAVNEDDRFRESR